MQLLFDQMEMLAYLAAKDYGNLDSNHSHHYWHAFVPRIGVEQIYE